MDTPTPTPTPEAAPAVTPDTPSDPIEAAITSSLHPAESEPAPTDAPPAGDGSKDADTERDELAELFGITAKGKDKWTSRVYYSKINKAWKEHQAKLTAAHEKALSEASKPHLDRIAAMEAEQEQVRQLILSDDARFMQNLAEMNPAFRRYLERAADQLESEPQPDVELTDGRKVYSSDQQRKREEWLLKQAEQRIAKRYEPLEKEHKQRQMTEAALPRVKARLETAAEKWPMFTDNRSDILKALQADQKIDLHDAYIQVVVPKLIADRTKMREEILAELAAKPRSTATVPTPGAAKIETPTDGMDPIEKAIRDSLRKP